MRRERLIFFLKVNKNSTIIYFLKPVGGFGGGGWSVSQSLPGARGSLRTQQLKEGFQNSLDSALFHSLLFYTPSPTSASPVVPVLVLTSVFFINVSENKCGGAV